MEIKAREQSNAELRKKNDKLIWANLISLGAILLLALKLATQSEIIIHRTPGMPNDSVIEKTAMDKGAQRATLNAVTSAIAQVNPANYEYMKAMLQAYLAPAAYTKVSKEIDEKVQLLVQQRELGSYYFVWRSYEYDPQTDRHFVIGDVHTVNAAKDTPAPFVFEYAVHVENYRLVVDSAASYAGDRAHDSEWQKANKR